jgi:hypothetical protein
MVVAPFRSYHKMRGLKTSQHDYQITLCELLSELCKLLARVTNVQLMARQFWHQAEMIPALGACSFSGKADTSKAP